LGSEGKRVPFLIALQKGDLKAKQNFGKEGGRANKAIIHFHKIGLTAELEEVSIHPVFAFQDRREYG